MRGAVAAGHPLTVEAACEMLRRGGNAFDAALAAGFAATVAEPTLCSLGGGGFMLAHSADTGEDVLFDFFVDTPGRGLGGDEEQRLIPVNVKFTSAVQVFHIGWGSVAVPGVLKGLLHCHERLCSLDLSEIIAPSIKYLEDGVEINDSMRYLINILGPILLFSEYGREVYGRAGMRRIRNPLLLEFLRMRDPQAWMDAFYGAWPGETAGWMREGGGLLTAEDMQAYEVVERLPLYSGYRGYDIVTNPPPSFGGSILSQGLQMLAEMDIASMNEADEFLCKVDVMEGMNRAARAAASGTTHISVIDERGNAASMTMSNGSNSGCFFGNTGIMLNNMMGEDDLHPDGFQRHPSGVRVGSMMSPTVIMREGRVWAALGSGGSKRIRTVMLQVISNLTDRGMDVRAAVEAPRLHPDDDGVLQVEPGFPPDAISALGAGRRLNLWGVKDMFFGGVHTVLSDLSAWGDSRRGGAFGRVA